MRSVRGAIGAAVLVALTAFLISGCSGDGSSSAAAPASATDAVSGGLTLVALGDSWPAGGHCDGCRSFAGRYADGLEEATGSPVRFVDLTESVVPGTTRGATPESLLAELKNDERVRERVADADVILISTGPNDLDNGSLEAYLAGTCGGTDGAACFRPLKPNWRTNFDAILKQIGTLRDGQPTATRLVTAENFFLSDPGLIEQFGRRFGPTTGAMIIDELATAMCGAAEANGAICIDARRILNGPTMDRPAEENSIASHQKLADALVASGLAELGR